MKAEDVQCTLNSCQPGMEVQYVRDQCEVITHPLSEGLLCLQLFFQLLDTSLQLSDLLLESSDVVGLILQVLLQPRDLLRLLCHCSLQLCLLPGEVVNLVLSGLQRGERGRGKDRGRERGRGRGMGGLLNATYITFPQFSKKMLPAIDSRFKLQEPSSNANDVRTYMRVLCTVPSPTFKSPSSFLLCFSLSALAAFSLARSSCTSARLASRRAFTLLRWLALSSSLLREAWDSWSLSSSERLSLLALASASFTFSSSRSRWAQSLSFCDFSCSSYEGQRAQRAHQCDNDTSQCLTVEVDTTGTRQLNWVGVERVTVPTPPHSSHPRPHAATTLQPQPTYTVLILPH